MDPFDASEFSGLTFDSEFESFLGLPANGGTAASNGETSNVSPYRHQGFGQPGGKDTQCSGCAKYKVDLDRMSQEHKINFQLLKKKIINTDLVLRKWKEQKDECDLLRTETEEYKRKLDQAVRDSEILSQQLSTAILNIKPMQEEKERLQAQLELKSTEVIELNDRIEGDKALKLQRTAQDEYNRNLENEVTKLKRTTTTMTAKTRSLESRLKDLASDKKGLTCTKHVLERRLDSMAVALHEAQEKCQSYWERLKQNDLATRDRRPAFIPSGLKSIVRLAVDKKNGIFTDPTSETANQAASGDDDDDDVSLHSDARNNSDWDNISEMDSEGDNDIESQKGVEDGHGPAQPKTDNRLSATNECAVISQKHQSPRKQVESDIKTLPQLRKVSQMLPQSPAKNIAAQPRTDNRLSATNESAVISQKHQSPRKQVESDMTTLPQLKKVSQMLPQPPAENIAQKLPPKLSKHAGGQRDVEGTACKLSHNKQAPSADHSQRPIEREIGAAHLKDVGTSHKLPDTMKIFSTDKRKEYSRNIFDRSKENSIVSSKSKLGQVNRTNLNQNNKNGDVDSLDDTSLSSLSSLSSSDDDNDIDEFLNFGSTSDYIQGKGRGLNLDTAFSFAEIENLLSPLSVSPRPVSSLSSRSVSPVSPHPASPRSPHPVPLLPQLAESELSASPPPASSPVSSLAGVDSSDEGDTTVDCLFASEFASSESQPVPHGDNRKKMYPSDSPKTSNVKADAVKYAESASRDGGYQNLIVSRSQSVGFTPATNDAGDICGLDVADDSISDNVSGVAILAGVNISKDVSDAPPLTDCHMLENTSNNATVLDRSDSEYSSNNTTVMDHSISENICTITTGTDRSMTDNISDMETCVEIYILKNASPAGRDRLSTPPEVADTCDNKSVIKITQASDTELALSQMDPSLNTHALDLTSPLYQSRQTSDTLSLDLKSPPPLSHQTSDTLSLDLKSPSLSQTHQTSDTLSLDLKSPALPQTHMCSDTLSLDLKSPPLSQTHQLVNTQILDSKSPAPLSHQTSDTLSLDLKSPPPLSHQTSDTLSLDLESPPPLSHQTSDTLSLDLKSPPLSQTLQTSDTLSLDLKSPALPQTHMCSDTLSLDLKFPPLSQTHMCSDTLSLDLKSPPLSQTHQLVNTQILDSKSPPPLSHQTSDTLSLDLKSPPPLSHQTSDTLSLDLKSPSLPQTHQLVNTQILDSKSSSPLLTKHQSLNTQVLDLTTSSSLPQAQPSANTQVLPLDLPKTKSTISTNASDIKSSSVLLEIQQPSNIERLRLKSDRSLNTPASDITLPTPLPTKHQSLNIKASDRKSLLTVPQMHQSLNMKDSDIKSSLIVAEMHQSLNMQPGMQKSLNTQTSDLKSSAVPQVNLPLNAQTLDIKSPSAVPQMHQRLSTQDSDLMSSPAMPQIHQSLDTASDIKSSSVLPERHQLLLLDVFNFFSLPPLLSPLPPSPLPRQRNEDLPLVKFNSAAPANVQKVTPRHQVERKAIGSMSSQIIEARKLMAKRKAAVLVQPMAVTNGNRRKRTATVAEISPAVPTKRKKLASLSGFPNAKAAIMYDLRQFLTAKDVDLKMVAETMLSRVEEGNTKAAWEMLCHVTLNYLESTHQDGLTHLMSACEKEGIIDTVFIREDERRLVLLISAFWRRDESLDRRHLMGLMWTAIFKRGCSNQLGRLSYCRMFTSLCLEQGDLEQVRILVYNIAWCDYLDLVHPLMAIVGVWPQVLDCSYTSCIKNVLKFMLREKCKADSSLLHKVTLVLQRVCQFDLSKGDESPETLLKNLLQLMEQQVLDGVNGSKLENTFETMKTIELLLVYQGPEWTEKHFLKSILVSFAMKWENKRVTKTGPPDELITCLFRIFRAVIAVQSPTLIAVAIVLGSVFPRFLNSKTGDAGMMATCIDALLDLAPFSPDKCLDMLKKWQATQKNIPAETLSKLQQVQSMPSQKAPPKKQLKGWKHKKPK